MNRRNTLPILSIVLVVFLHTQVSARSETTTEKLIKYGDYYYQHGQYTKAIETYNKVLKSSNCPVQVYLKRGIVYNRLDRSSEAFRDLNKVLRTNPDNSEAYKWRGKTYSDIGEYDEAIKDYTRALNLKRATKTVIYRWRATAYNALGNVVAAIKDASTGINLCLKEAKIKGLNPKTQFELPILHEVRGNIYFNEGNYSRAIDDFSACIKYGFISDSILKLRAKAYAESKKPQLAMRDLTKLISINKDDESAYTERANIEAHTGLYKDAVSDYTKAIKLYPGENPSRLYLERAKVFDKLGDKNSARQDRLKAKKIRSDYF